MGHVDINGACYTLADGRVLLDDITFRVGEGAKVALIGANAPASRPYNGSSQDAAGQTFGTLSGGQQARFQILLLELSGANLLLLDEPTDNLDLVSAEELEGAFDTFQGRSSSLPTTAGSPEDVTVSWCSEPVDVSTKRTNLSGRTPPARTAPRRDQEPECRFSRARTWSRG